jgi:hypothetical protein
MHPIAAELERASDERFLAIYESLAEQGFGPLDSEVAKRLRFRPHAIRKLPMAKRAACAKKILGDTNNVELAYELFGTYLVKNHKDLVTGFLDATGVAHAVGLIVVVENGVPETAKIAEAITALDGAHDPADVTLYLALCAEQWPEQEELKKVWESRSETVSG